MNPAASSDWIDPFVLNLLTGAAVLAASIALGGWVAWRRHRAERRREAQGASRNEHTEST